MSDVAQSCPDMPVKLRELYLRVVGSVPNVHQVTVQLHYLDCMFPREKLLEAVSWLVRKGITGSNFVEWFHTKCHGSHLEMHRELIRAVERERYARRLTVEKDLRT